MLCLKSSDGDVKWHLQRKKAQILFLDFVLSISFYLKCSVYFTINSKLDGWFLTHLLVPSSIETAKQKVEKDSLHQKAELKFLKKQKKIAELQKKFKQLLNLNQSLPEHVHLTHEVHTLQKM